MYALYIFALVIHAVYSTSPCRDGIEIVSRETKDFSRLVGNWSYVYHWDKLNKFDTEFQVKNEPMKCSSVTIRETTPAYIQKKQAECSDSVVPFNWLEGRLILDAPDLNMKDAVLFIGNENSWLMTECKKMLRVEMRTVYDNFVVFVNPDMAGNTYMIAREIPSLEDLKCVAHNVDFGKGISGMGLCY